ncbi:hypothetical protein DV096_19430 [Bradymonadaceae bacterium TMQ3]|nr:hypothetical protein DV096_19430 [Bradymonadaceae bacterium TMQ3]TXC68479.1 hypothetical protein FRC91_19215 [Bradymonadales bacterium TMQ1]
MFFDNLVSPRPTRHRAHHLLLAASLTASAILTFAGCASAQLSPSTLGAEQSTGASSSANSARSGPGVCPPAPLSELGGCTRITGDLIIENIRESALPDLGSIERVEGSLIVRQSFLLNHLEGLRNLEVVGADVMLVGLPGLATLEGLSKLRVIGGELHMVEVGVDACRVAEFIRDQRERGYQGPAHIMGVDPSPACQVDFESPELAGPATALSDADAEPRLPPNPSLPPITLPDYGEIRGGNHLQTIHPEIALRARLLYALLQHEGIEVVFISGHRSWSPPGGRRLASWHHVGMAFDLNLTHRATMSEANRHYEADRNQWERIGELAEGLGIIWGARYDDIFHFEWHPGHHARMRQQEFDAFRELAGQDLGNYRQGWSLYKDDLQNVDETPPCLGGCYIPPDKGLSELLESLR